MKKRSPFTSLHIPSHPFTSILHQYYIPSHQYYIDKMYFASCRSHMDTGTVSVFTMESGTVSIFTMFSSLGSSVFDERTSVSIVEIDSVWCALLSGSCSALLGGSWWILASGYVSRRKCRGYASADNNGCSTRCIWPTGFWIRGCATFQIIHVDVEDARICVNLNPYHPFHGCAHYLVVSNPW